MALKGTIKDFGIADIFQLIGQQAKTGVLILSYRDQIKVYFREGAVVRAETGARPRHLLLGEMMVNAELLTKAQLEAALNEQQRTLRRIGLVLADMGLVNESEVREFTRLQLMETVCVLFEWKAGTYEFEQVDVEDPRAEGVEPVRAETILMEGLRMIDEWPQIKRRLPDFSVELLHKKPLPEPTPELELPSGEDLDVSFDEELPPATSMPKKNEPEITASERRVYELIEPGRPVQKIMQLSRLGQFETARAAANLLAAGFVELKDSSLEQDVQERRQRKAWSGFRRAQLVLVRSVIYVLLIALALVMYRGFDGSVYGIESGPRARYQATTIERFLAQSRLQALRRAVEIYRLQHGDYPPDLRAMVAVGLLSDSDVRFPYRRPYFYRREGGKVLILPPVH
jgi:hypothetical protein